MVENSPLTQEEMWKLLVYIDHLEEEISFDSLLNILKVDEEILLKSIEFFSYFNYTIPVKKRNGKKYINPPDNKLNVTLVMKLTEWLSLQAHFPLMEKFSKLPFHQTMARCMGNIEKAYPYFDLYSYLEKERSEKEYLQTLKRENKETYILVQKIENAIKERSRLVVFAGTTKIEVYPFKMEFINGGLAVICEDCSDKCLMSIYLQSVDKVTVDPVSYHPTNDQCEVRPFINKMRNIHHNEKRVILKIHRDDLLQVTPPFHLLGRPFITYTSDGHYIWAANLEITETFFEWLEDMGGGVEILDPPEAKKEFQEYCQDTEEEDNRLKKTS